MTVVLAVALYLTLVVFVLSSLTYYFKVIRPKDERRINN
jgi:hypothetical protein